MAVVRQWRFFVDESGDFSKDVEIVCVAGYLLPLAADMGSQNLRGALERIAPGMPWPLHMAHLPRPSMLVLAAQIDADRHGRRPESDITSAMAILVAGTPGA